MTDLELLAPARNADIGIAAIDCGADAVYIAGPGFGARQAAGNPVGDIRRLCDYAHRFGARIFVTVNTIIYDDELEDVRSLVREVAEAGADAVIVQDLALTTFDVDVPLHASTQCAIRTPGKAAFLESLGFSRLILERELSLEQIRDIRKAVRGELEFFVHGALCVCYSGQCYLSEHIAGRSANRGACIQACRSLYDLKDADGKTLVRSKALLSLKDYNLSERLEDLAEAGISSFKIEGRLKNESYVRNVVREYSDALDTLVAKYPGKYRRASFGSVGKSFVPATDKTFNRGYTELFLDSMRGQWASMDAAKGMGKKVGSVASVNRAKTEFFIGGSRERFSNGDGFSFIDKGGRVIGFRADVVSGNRISCKAVPQLYTGAVLYRNFDVAFEKELSHSKVVREIPVGVTMDISWDEHYGRFSIRAEAVSEDGRRAVRTVDGGEEKAVNCSRMLNILYSQLAKSVWHYDFYVEDINIHDDGMVPLLPASAVNNIRRELAAAIESSPCIRRPLSKGVRASGDAAAGFGGAPGAVSIDVCKSVPDKIDFSFNVANHLARKVYEDAGACTVEPAYELSHCPGASLMRTRYCIRHELGMCLKDNPSCKGPLFLENNGRRLALKFNCRDCEMTVEEA